MNFIKRLLRIYRLKKFNSLKIKSKPKLSAQQIDELIEINKEVLTNIGDDMDYDGMGNHGRFPSEKK
jgi:predicted transglutaminase-like cysteine proteinase